MSHTDCSQKVASSPASMAMPTSEVADSGCHTSAPKSLVPVSATGTYLSPIWTSRMILSTCERLTRSRWHGTQRCTTLPSMPRSGTQPFQWLRPPLSLQSSLGHCTSMRRPRFTLSYTWEGSAICTRLGTMAGGLVALGSVMSPARLANALPGLLVEEAVEMTLPRVPSDEWVPSGPGWPGVVAVGGQPAGKDSKEDISASVNSLRPNDAYIRQ